MTWRQSLRRIYQVGSRTKSIRPLLLLENESRRSPRHRVYRAALYYFRWFLPLSTASSANTCPPAITGSTVRSLHAKSFSTISVTVDNHQVLSALENLASRLGEWEPNLSPPLWEEPAGTATPSVGKLPANNTTSLSIEEYSRIFCGGYFGLPPLQLEWVAESLASPCTINTVEKRDWDCPRSAILLFLATDCGVSSPSLSRFLERLRIQDDTKNDFPVLLRLRQLSTPIFEDIFQCLFEHNSQTTLALLVQLRGDLLKLMTLLPKRQNDQSINTALQHLERHLRRLLSAWISPGMLEIRRITFDTTPAGIIEKIALKEAVHRMKGLEDLRGRLGPQRRVFALFHPLLRDEPLVILHVHLETKTSNDDSHIPASMAHVFAKVGNSELPSPPRVVTFYSISNTQAGLTRGLGLGEFLIKQAVKCLQQEFHSGGIETFVTLSPMPGFRKWLEGLFKAMPGDDVQKWAQHLADHAELTPHMVDALINARPELEKLLFYGGGYGTSERTLDHDSHEQTSPIVIEELLEKLKPTLMRLAAHYLILAKDHRSGKPLDPVTGFHVHNGAEVFRINFAADLSTKGLQRSFGVMVNYRYRLDKLESNQAMFESSHFKEIPMTSSIRDLLNY